MYPMSASSGNLEMHVECPQACCIGLNPVWLGSHSRLGLALRTLRSFLVSLNLGNTRVGNTFLKLGWLSYIALYTLFCEG